MSSRTDIDTKEKLENKIMTIPSSAHIIFVGTAGSAGTVVVTDVRIANIETRG
jgi:hypothetical protein